MSHILCLCCFILCQRTSKRKGLLELEMPNIFLPRYRWQYSTILKHTHFLLYVLFVCGVHVLLSVCGNTHMHMCMFLSVSHVYVWVCAYVSVCRPMSFLILLYFKVGSFISIHNSHDSACLASLLVPKITCRRLGIQCMPSCLSDVHSCATDLTSRPTAYTESLLSAKPSLKALRYVIHTRSHG